MPPQAADLEEALNKKGGLTLSQLANYDDLITDALVDKVYYWSIIRKLKASYHGSRGIPEEEICKILQRHVVINKDPAAAQVKLLQLKGLDKFHRSLKTEDEREHFVRHLRKYINIWLTDCPFEVCTTNRYTITTAEACIVARKPIRDREPIKYLTGIQVEMTEREEKELSSRTDFSIVLSSRRKRPSLFLGPARFANHDCNPNAKLTTTGPHGIHIVARRDIALGEEITVKYGDNYFGDDNCECLCGSCEKELRNGWDPRGPIVHESSSEEEDSDEEEETPRPSKRKADPSPPRKRKRAADEEDLPAKRRSGLSALSNKRDDHGRFLKNSRGRSSKGEQKRANFDEPDEPLLDRVFRLLGSVADRNDRKKRGLSMNDTLELTPQGTCSSPSAKSVEEDVDMHDAADDEAEELTRPPRKETTVNNRTIVRGRGGLFVKKSSFVQTEEEVRQETANSKMASTKKASSKVEATEVDIYSVPPSPEPPTLTSRGRGRPDKQPLPEEANEDSTGGSSPESNEAGDSSSASQASSATSVDDFTAGTIAQGICDMYTTEDPVEEGEEEHDEGETKTTRTTRAVVTTTETRISRTRSKSRLAREADQLLSPEKLGRGRDIRRKSPRTGAVDSPSKPVNSIEKGAGDGDDEEDGVSRGEPRTPGDYTLCAELVAAPYHRWVECRNCDEFFVQAEAFQTRIACPRCERHSKLYGYYWPKTDKEGKNDKEERILDHRLIHRFVPPDEERDEKKGRKALHEVLREKEASASHFASEEVELDTTVRRLRQGLSPRRSESQLRRTRSGRMTM